MSDTHVSIGYTPGRQGAKRQTWNEDSLRSWVKHFIETHTQNETLSALEEKVALESDARTAVCDYFLANVIMAMTRKPRKPAAPPDTAPSERSINAMFKVAAVIERAFLSDYRIDGIPLGECTMAAVRSQAAKHGIHARFLAAIAQDHPDEGVVANYYNDDTAAALFVKASTPRS